MCGKVIVSIRKRTSSADGKKQHNEHGSDFLTEVSLRLVKIR